MNSGIDLQNIATTMSKLNYDLSQKMKSDNEALIELADEMAERATTFGGQGYKAFLESFVPNVAWVLQLSIIHLFDVIFTILLSVMCSKQYNGFFSLA